jgi:hypothetical protein
VGWGGVGYHAPTEALGRIYTWCSYRRSELKNSALTLEICHTATIKAKLLFLFKTETNCFSLIKTAGKLLASFPCPRALINKSCVQITPNKKTNKIPGL